MFDSFYRAAQGEGLAFGTHCSYKDIGMFEMCGSLGYDYVWIDAEHGALSLDGICNGIVGANAGGAAALIRVAGFTQQDVKPILDMGPQAIVFPMVNTPEEAETAVKLCQYPPRGTRGFNPLRAMRYNQQPIDEYLREADDKILRMIQCEHIDSVRRLPEILEVPDISCVIIGPMDLSASVGKLGKLGDPELIGLYTRIAAVCKERRIPFGTSIPYIPELMRFWIELGAAFLSVSNVYECFNLMSRRIVSEARSISEKR